MQRFDNQAIAARIRGLLSGQGDYGVIAKRIGVHETALRISADDVSPYPTLDVIAAVVRVFGVDPTWLMTGEYNSSSHREAIEASTSEMPAVVQSIAERIDEQNPPQLKLLH